jgi:alpha-1,6-mannosyltransferase
MLTINPKYSINTVLLSVVSCYFVLGYYFERQEFLLLIFIYTFVFAIYFFYCNSKRINAKIMLQIGLLFRIALLFSTPFLSQDFYRFIWDGRLIMAGINPYAFTPNQIINSPDTIPQLKELYQGMGSLSASHFTNYPPFNQLIFALGGLVAGKSILGTTIFFRLVIILADVGIFYFGRKVLIHLKQNPNKIFWYFLNPLVILELTGNLHFEGVMLFLLILGIYYLIQNKWLIASLFIALSISTKLLPLLLLPLLWQIVRPEKRLRFYSLILLLNIIFFLPFLTSNLVKNYTTSIALWFVNFEFNASIYYLVRAIGFYTNGYNIIGVVGKIIPLISIAIILFFAFIKKNNSFEKIMVHSLMVLSLYFFLSTTVHPWYCINLVLLGVFTKYKFPIVWSFFIILSYYAYSVNPFKENFYLLLVEYGVVYGVFLYEINTKSTKLISYGK